MPAPTSDQRVAEDSDDILGERVTVRVPADLLERYQAAADAGEYTTRSQALRDGLRRGAPAVATDGGGDDGEC